MKATGIVRRVDDLGRIVIPKEIRRTLKIREGDPLEIFTGRDGAVTFKKYSIMGSLEDFDFKLISMMEEIVCGTIIVTNRDEIIGCSPKNKRELSGKTLSEPFIKLMKEREIYVQNVYSLYASYIPIMNNYKERDYKESAYVAVPINVMGSIEGSVVLIDCENKNITEENIRKCEQLAELFANKFEL